MKGIMLELKQMWSSARGAGSPTEKLDLSTQPHNEM